jgi:hypothetical protein
VSFHSQPFESRYTTLGDIAEGVFEKVWPYPFERSGIKRPSVSVGAIPPMVRAAPDYYDRDGFIEVMGFGDDQTVKLKDQKHEVLLEWEKYWTVRIFVWDSHNKRWSIASLRDIEEVIINDGWSSAFHDGNTYNAIAASDWPGEWTKA